VIFDVLLTFGDVHKKLKSFVASLGLWYRRDSNVLFIMTCTRKLAAVSKALSVGYGCEIIVEDLLPQ